MPASDDDGVVALRPFSARQGPFRRRLKFRAEFLSMRNVVDGRQTASAGRARDRCGGRRTADAPRQIGRGIRGLRKARGLTLAALAEASRPLGRLPEPRRTRPRDAFDQGAARDQPGARRDRELVLRGGRGAGRRNATSSSGATAAGGSTTRPASSTSCSAPRSPARSSSSRAASRRAPRPATSPTRTRARRRAS